MGKLDQYCFDGTNALSLKKLPTDSKKDQVDKEKILAKTEKNQEQKQIEGLPTQEKKKIKQFQNLMNYDGTKQRVIEDED